MLDDIKILREAFETNSKEYKDRNAFMAVLNSKENGTYSLDTVGWGYCHGPLAQHNRKISKEVSYVLSSVQNLRVNKKEALQFFYWLANDSPWSQVFVTKDPQDILDFGWVVDTEHPSNLVISALIASRFVTESYDKSIVPRFKVYQKLLSLGYSNNIAFSLSFLLNYQGDGLVYAPYNAGHSPFDMVSVNEGYIKNFIQGFAKNSKSTTFKQERGYTGGVHLLWGDAKNTNAFKSFVKNLKLRSKGLKKELNIFKRKDEDVNWIAKEDEDIKDMVDQILERVLNDK